MERKHHTTRLAERRDKDRKRQARRRARLKAANAPLTHTIDRAVIAGLRHAIAESTTPEGMSPELFAFMNLISKRAMTVLVDRGGYDSSASREAFTKRLAKKQR